MQTPFHSVLRHAQESGEWVSIVDYAEELKPSEPKLRKILSIDTDGRRIQVEREDGSQASYRINVVLYVETSTGRTINHPALQTLEGYIENREERELHREALRNLSTQVDESFNRIAIIKELAGTFQGQPQPFFVLHNTASQRTAVIACSKSHAQRLVDIVNDGQGFWEFADFFIAARFMWPIWIRHKEDTIPEALELPALFDWGKTTPGELVRLYVTKGWVNHKLFKPNDEHISRADASRLQAHALCTPGPELPIAELMRHVKFVELKKTLQARNIKPQRNRELVIEQYGEHMSKAVELELRHSPSLIGTYFLLPPAGFTWESWHDLRESYVNMHAELTSWLSGYTEDNNKYSALV